MHIHRQESELLESQAGRPYRKDSVGDQSKRLQSISDILYRFLETLGLLTIGITNHKNLLPV
jgi:hypothetical protein